MCLEAVNKYSLFLRPTHWLCPTKLNYITLVLAPKLLLKLKFHLFDEILTLFLYCPKIGSMKLIHIYWWIQKTLCKNVFVFSCDFCASNRLLRGARLIIAGQRDTWKCCLGGSMLSWWEWLVLGGLIWKRFVLFLLKGFLWSLSEKLNLHVKSGIQSQGLSNYNTPYSKEEKVDKNQSFSVLRTVMLTSDTTHTDFCWKFTLVTFSNTRSPFSVLS